jgi:hypothetical protein
LPPKIEKKAGVYGDQQVFYSDAVRSREALHAALIGTEGIVSPFLVLLECGDGVYEPTLSPNFFALFRAHN